MTNKITLTLLGLSLFALGLAKVMTILSHESYLLDIILEYGLAIIELLGLFMLLRNSSFIVTVYFRIILFGTGVTLLGAMFKIMHWPGASVLLLTSLLGIALTYTIRFTLKKQKGQLDVFKLLWVLTSYVTAAMILQHWIPREFIYVPKVLFWVTLIDFVLVGYKTKTLYEN